jgi:hypothetical protein
MKILRLYKRVLGLLGPQISLGWVLALANVALAAAQFAEPVLFRGLVIQVLAVRDVSVAAFGGTPPGTSAARVRWPSMPWSAREACHRRLRRIAATRSSQARVLSCLRDPTREP